MSEEPKASDTKAPENPGVLVKHKPARPWEYRLIHFGGDLVFAEFRCMLEACVKPMMCRMNAAGTKTIGATICPTCQRKVYVRFDEKWFECS